MTVEPPFKVSLGGQWISILKYRKSYIDSSASGKGLAIGFCKQGSAPHQKGRIFIFRSG